MQTGLVPHPCVTTENRGMDRRGPPGGARGPSLHPDHQPECRFRDGAPLQLPAMDICEDSLCSGETAGVGKLRHPLKRPARRLTRV